LGNWQELAKQHQAELAIAVAGIALAVRYCSINFAAEATPNFHQSFTAKHSLLQAELVVGHLE
jgi:hypothetical protein